MKLHTPEELRAWLDRPCPPREQDRELVTRPPEVWPELERPVGATNLARKQEVRGCPFDEQLGKHA